ncbi:unnamed protein product [Candida verbasci]|uniref:anthranilate synthase n=1 Tax=Candida verbasci TaxID=1227364 RepID=A0A9W4TRZ9_9ASCO|nr:unnamed protein product [Candida verbasci]
MIQPSLDTLHKLVTENTDSNVFPIYKYVPNNDITIHQAYLKLSKLNNPNRSPNFLFESSIKGDSVDRYSFIGINPSKIIKTGDNDSFPEKYRNVDPISILESELSQFKQASLSNLPRFSGGATGYISYDCIKYFEPKTKKDLKDVLKLPEAVFMFCDLVVAFDHVYQRFQIIYNINKDNLEGNYKFGVDKINEVEKSLLEPTTDDILPRQGPIKLNQSFTSNIGQEGYESHVTTLKNHILKGDIIQAVPSQRVARPTSLHPFNIYKHLRTVNPSPYLFYIDLIEFQIIGASPELLVSATNENKVITHPIAGTMPRGKTNEEDEQNADILRQSLKDRAEHIMLVDLARNDINRICQPKTTNVDKLLTIQRFSHVMHLVSEVSGILRDDKNRFDAFRSIFPAGTVSGAPKVKAMELIGELEKEKRGIYAGAVGHWGYDGKTMDTCIALRTMVYKDGIAYLQAGGGIVFDSDEYEEYIETMNKMKANNNTIIEAESIWSKKVDQKESDNNNNINTQASNTSNTTATTTTKPSRTPTSWDAEDDILLMHLKDNQKLGWKEIASNFNNRTPNACQFRWRRLKSGNLKNPPKSAAALGSQFKQNPNMISSVKKKKQQQLPSNQQSPPNNQQQPPPSASPPKVSEFNYNPMSNVGTFQGFDNNISTALAGLNALSNSPSYISSPQPTTPRIINNNDNNNESNNSPDSPKSDHSYSSTSASSLQPIIPGTSSGGYYAEVSVDPTMNLPHNRSHPETPSALTPRNSTTTTTTNTSHHPHHPHHPSVTAAAAALRNNSIIQIHDDRNSISSLARASVSSLPSKSMNIPHHQTTTNALAHLPVLFGGAGSISGPSRNSSISGPSVQQTTVSSLRNSSVVSNSGGYYSRSGSVVIPHNSDEIPLKIDKERIDANNKKLNKIRRNLPSSSNTTKKTSKDPPRLDIPWTMEEDELLINRRNRELSFAELSILLPTRTEGEIWKRIDYLEKLKNGNHRSTTKAKRNRQSSIGLDVDDLYDDEDEEDDEEDVIGKFSDDDNDNNDVLIDVDADSNFTHNKRKKRRASSAINPLSMKRSIRK